MKKRSIQEEFDNIILPVIAVVILFVISGFLFDTYYELNDDMVIKDILAGSYMGKPDGHTNQLLYPLGFVLSKLYLVFSRLPVLGIFLSSCFAVCFVMIGYRSLSFYSSRKVKAAVILLESALLFSMYLWELVYMQYSVVSGMLAATACFWFYTMPKGMELKEFFKQGLPALFLVWVAFLVRSEMLLLMCPFLAAVGLMHWVEETKMQLEEYIGPEKISGIKKMFCRDNLFRYVGLVAVMVVGMGVILMLDSLAYQSSEWKEFRQFFDARTKVYDYTWYPTYEDGEEFYAENGISKEQYQLIDSYNFGLDPSLDVQTLEKIAGYGERQRILGNYGVRIKNAIWEMGHNMLAREHAPYNYFVLVSYGLVIGLAAVQKRKDYSWKLLLLLVMRTISWSYLYWSARVVNRIAHPLYMIEFLILTAMLVTELYDRPLWNIEKYYRRAAGVVYLLMILIVLPFSYQKVKAEQLTRENLLVNQELLDDYCKEHGENYYYLDVYSSVAFVEKVYKNVDNSHKNYDLLGGWLCHSPLQKQLFNGNMEENLLQENFYFVIENIGDTAFLTDYYGAKGIEVILELQDTVGEGENPFLIYKVVQDSGKNSKKK